MGGLFFIVWLILFLIRKDTRREMLLMSLIFGLAGPLTDVLYYKDWWSPLTVTNSVISFEAFFVGFSLGGIISVLYEEIFKDHLREKRRDKRRKRIDTETFLIILIIMGVIFFGSYFLLGLNSLIATILAMTIPTLFIWFKRKDLMKVSLLSGVLTLSLAVMVYSLLDLITPDWVNVFWHFKNVPTLIILNVPIDDIIWYFLAGCLIAPLYPFWHEGKLIKI
ncbi:MAG: lycopene cyclase domain-containing protein [Patescibacteria group bacterium]